jgi:putative addiction module CopG family antidote
MAGRQVRTISLSRELDQFVASQVASGQYSTASEAVRAGLRALVAQQIPRPVSKRTAQ